MPSTDRKLELQANDIDVSTVSQTTAYWTDLASPVASEKTECSNGLMDQCWCVCAVSGTSAYCDMRYWLWRCMLAGWLVKQFSLFGTTLKILLWKTVVFSFSLFRFLLSLYINIFLLCPYVSLILLKHIIFITSIIFPKAWPFSKRCWANFQLVLLFLNVLYTLFQNNCLSDLYVSSHSLNQLVDKCHCSGISSVPLMGALELGGC